MLQCNATMEWKAFNEEICFCFFFFFISLETGLFLVYSLKVD